MRNAYTAICSCQARGVPPELGVLSGMLSEEEIATLSQLLARNYDIALIDGEQQSDFSWNTLNRFLESRF